MTTLLNIKVAPRRMLTKQEAAIYCGVALTRFDAHCSCSPVAVPGGHKMYDIKDLDRWLDSLKAPGADSDESILGRLPG